MKQKKLERLGVLTAGGDCPGINAVLRAVTKTALQEFGFEVWGIEDGYEGLIEKRGRFLSNEDVSGILTHGGTILGTSNRANPFHFPQQKRKQIVFEDRSKNAFRHFREWGLDGLVIVGGDGTLGTAHRLSQMGMPVIGIPKTIDNDLSGTDWTFGFDTAVEIATEAVDRLHTTAEAHHRVMILEVMGRHAGWIALYAGSAGGADIILIPEIPYRFPVICQEVKHRAGMGKRFSLVVVAEGAHEQGGKPFVRKRDFKNPYPEKLGGVAYTIAEKIEALTGIESRAAVLGHIQRGGSPTPFDRNLGTLYGSEAIHLFAKRRWGRMVCLRGGKISSVPLKDIVHRTKKVPRNHQLISAARAVGTSFGDKLHKAR